MAIHTLNSTHQILKDALENLKKAEVAMEDGKKEREMAMIDLYSGRVSRAEKEVIKTAKDFIHYLSESCIKF